MKSAPNPLLRLSTLLAATVAITTSAYAADFTWDGGTGNWNSTNWNSGTASGPTTAGNTATINSGTAWANVGVGGVDSITVGVGGTVGFWNGVYQGVGNLNLQGGTVIGNNSYNAYGASILGNLTVSGTAPSTITGNSWFNLGSSTTFTVADATGDSASDLLVNLSLRSLPGSPDWTYLYNSKIVKEGAGTMEMTVHSYFNAGLDLNGGTLKVSNGNGGYGYFASAVNVNAGTTLETVSDGTGLGYQNGWKPSSVNINGGTITTTGTSHIWGISGGINMTGGTLQSNSGVSDANGPQLEWNYANVTTNASADTATIGGRIRIRADGGYGGISFDVADGAAATDLLVSAAVTEASGGRSITKTGAGTMVLSGNNSYSGPTTLNAGTLVISGSSDGTSAINVNSGTLSLGNGTSNSNLSDGATVDIASGATVELNFSVTNPDTVGKLIIDGNTMSGGTYNATTHPTVFTGTGSLVVLNQDGIWTSTSSGNWGTSSNWQSNVIASGIDKTATFSAGTGSESITVTLDSARQIGNLTFSNADYTLAGSNTLTLDSSGIPAISVGSGRSATISANLGGTLGMEKTGDGTLVLSGVKSYTGGTTVTAGTLELNNSSTFDLSVVSGSVTVANGATLKLSGFDYTGLGRLGSPVTTLDVNGGTVNSSIESWVTGATVNLNGGTMSVSGSGRYQVISSAFNSLASANTSTISGNLMIRKDYGSSDLNIDVDDGTAATDLSISGSIQQVGTAGVNKYGIGKLVLSGTNTYTGNTVVNNGALEVGASGSLRFRPTSNGATNSVSGTVDATLSFLGTVDLDLGAAVAEGGNAWNLFNLGSFSGPTPTLAPTAVTSTTLGAFTEVTPGTWELPVTGAKWVFTEGDGNLAYVVTVTDYDNWVTANGVTGGENDDDDSDGLTNHEEYAFGLDPTGGSSVNAIAVPLDKSTGIFSYTRRLQSLTGLNYSVWYSTDLATWTKDTGAAEGTPAVSGEVETVPVTISVALLSNPKLFIQVRAD